MAPYTLFEISWEVCNKVGGIHTVVSTKAKTLVEKLGDDYIAIGPWLLSDQDRQPPFDPEPGFESFTEACRALGVPVRVGRWRIPSRPRTILVEFSRLFERKDEVLARNWEKFKVDSLFGAWDYVEPVLFGTAAGIVIEKWWEEYVAPRQGKAVVQSHEWMCGSAMLYLREKVPAIGHVFTTHATMLGRSIASRGTYPTDGLGDRDPNELATEIGIRAKHSMEGVCARVADSFTTVSEITATEAEMFHGRLANPLLPNGIDLAVIDEIAGSATRDEVRATLQQFAHRFLGESVDDAAFVCIAGRYEFHNKGIDLLLDAVAAMQKRPGRRVVLFVLVPAGNSGLRGDVAERMRRPVGGDRTPLGISTHNLFEPENDPVLRQCRLLGLDNAIGSRVKVVQIPIYFHDGDGFLNLPYEAVLRAMDHSAFPSFYEPWGYTPEESLAVGVPTITTDCAGFGLWAQQRGLRARDGVQVIARHRSDYATARDALVQLLEAAVVQPGERSAIHDACRKTAQLTAWSDLIQHYETAFRIALEAAELRAGTTTAYRPRFTALPVTPTAVGQRPQLQRFDVAPTLPDPLRALSSIAANYWWTWNHDAAALFAELSPRKWATTRSNPVQTLSQVFAADLETRVADKSFVGRVQSVAKRFDAYLAARRTEVELSPGCFASDEHPIAYFCAEFGIHESLPIYSGGLGILAGDHLKSASDLNLPLVGVGIYYRKGYMRQRLSPHHEQIAIEVDNDPAGVAAELVLGKDRQPLEITIQLPSSTLTLRAWRVQVGRVPLYLLDADVPSNRPEDRGITHHLYGGDQENRLLQEIVLGRGGVRLLHALGIEPCVHHLNEGHASFVAIERIGRYLRQDGLTFEEARELIRATTIFTTHTPIPAGHDRFPEGLVRRYFSDVHHWAGVPWERFYAFGQSEGSDGSFNMTMLANHFAGYVNGVSKLHGEVSRGILRPAWPMLLEYEVPVGSVTNGIHLPTWTAPEIAQLLGAEGRAVTADDFRDRADHLDAGALWETRRGLRRKLKQLVADRLRDAYARRHDSPLVLERVLAGLEEDALWIGFARRFVPYKRADLLFRSLERLAKILGDSARPVRVLFAGKAHPHDRAGQETVRRVAEIARSEPFLGKIVFIEDYDMELGRGLVQGVDVWLNNPIRPLEASGTSGMKVAANGGLNLSIADGWWPEAYDGQNGWTIGNSHAMPSQALQDEMESSHLYRLLEEEVVPLYFDRDADGMPQRWIARMKHALRTVPTVFHTDRMVGEYFDVAYRELGTSYHRLSADGRATLKHVAEEHRRIRRGFHDVRIVAAHVTDLRDLRVLAPVEARVEVDLGELRPDDVDVELVLGHARHEFDLHRPVVLRLRHEGTEGTRHVYSGAKVMDRSGTFAYGLRVRATQREAFDRILADLVLWAGSPR